ncbi:MAG: putative redox protein [Bacteroidia bacterium]|jgi:putative redox protein
MRYTSAVNYQGGLRTEAIHLKSNEIVRTDAPIDNNGKGALFSPTDLMATSLASCMLTVMGISAEACGIAFQHVSAKVEKIMASGPRRISELIVLIEITHDWSDKEKTHMQKIALNCPVAKSLHSSIVQNVEFRYL